MDPNQTSQISRKPLFWLSILLSIFIVKGVFLSVLFPFFQGPDEQTHYATIQYLAEPQEKNWPITKLKKPVNIGSDISTYGFSQETIRSAQATQFDEIKFQNENTQEFSQSAIGPNENEIVGNAWKRYIDIYPPNTSGTSSVYYFLGVKIDQLLTHQSILARFLSIRLLSVALGALVVWLAYLTAQKIGLSRWQGLSIAALVAFQPMLSATAAIVNIDIALIFAFSLFVYAAVSLLADGQIIWKYIALLIFSGILGLFSKGPGIILVVAAIPLLTYLIYLHFHIDKRRFFWRVFFLFSLLIALTFIFVPKTYLVAITNMGAVSQFGSPLISLGKYIDKTIGGSRFSISHASYWGNFGWLDTKISPDILDAIRIIELIAFLGLILYLFSGRRPFDKLRVTEEKSHLPQKRYIVFFIGIIFMLQLAIRFYDWRIFDATKQIVIGTPGRYFLPNIIPHILLLATGLGFFTRNKRQFDILLKTLALLMILLSLYSMINVIIPRYYL